MDEPPGYHEATFHVVLNGGYVYVVIRGEEAIIVVDQLNRDSAPLVKAINKARELGATRGTLFSGTVLRDQIARMNQMRAANNVTWMGGKVTRLADSPEGDPQFRTDFDVLPHITE